LKSQKWNETNWTREYSPHWIYKCTSHCTQAYMLHDIYQCSCPYSSKSTYQYFFKGIYPYHDAKSHQEASHYRCIKIATLIVKPTTEQFDPMGLKIFQIQICQGKYQQDPLIHVQLAIIQQALVGCSLQDYIPPTMISLREGLMESWPGWLASTEHQDCVTTYSNLQEVRCQWQGATDHGTGRDEFLHHCTATRDGCLWFQVKDTGWNGVIHDHAGTSWTSAGYGHGGDGYEWSYPLQMFRVLHGRAASLEFLYTCQWELERVSEYTSIECFGTADTIQLRIIV